VRADLTLDERLTLRNAAQAVHFAGAATWDGALAGPVGQSGRADDVEWYDDSDMRFVLENGLYDQISEVADKIALARAQYLAVQAPARRYSSSGRMRCAAARRQMGRNR
jgi:hypothetical protein